MHQLWCTYVAVGYSSFLVYLSQVFISEVLGGETSPKPSDFLNTKFHLSNLPVPTQYYSYSRNKYSCINYWLYEHSYQGCLSSPYKISYSYITSRSRLSLLLHETEGEARGQVLMTMISYECLWYNCFMSYCFNYKQIIR